MVTFIKTSATAQVALLIIFWLGGSLFARMTGAAIPGSFVGLVGLLLLLGTGTLDPRLVERGAGWLLAQMLLFFVPAVVALMAHPEFLGLVGLKVLLVIMGSTVIVMLAIALTVDLSVRWSERQSRTVVALE